MVEMGTMGSESGGGANEEKSKSSVHVPGNAEALTEALPTENAERSPKFGRLI